MKRLIPLAALVAALVCPVAALASPSHVRVSGVQSSLDLTAGAPGDPCSVLDPQTGAAPVFSNTMTGSLIGCWYTDTFIVTSDTTRDGTQTIRAIGTENFVGCLDVDGGRQCAAGDPHGTLAFTYTFEGSFDPTTGKEIRGGCQHPIVSGTGDFTGAGGRLEFTDDVAGGTSAYRGHITLAEDRRPAGATASAAAMHAYRPGC